MITLTKPIERKLEHFLGRGWQGRGKHIEERGERSQASHRSGSPLRRNRTG